MDSIDISKWQIKGVKLPYVVDYCLESPFPGSHKYEPNHPIWDCRVGLNNLSPKEAWYNEDYIFDAVLNMYKIYHYSKDNNKYPEFIAKIDKAFEGDGSALLREVLLRFTVAKIAPKVTALAPTTMLSIVEETGLNLADYPGVYCPMAGFGGIVEAINRYSKKHKITLDIEAYDINDKFCEYYGWTKRDVLAGKIKTDKIVIVCPPFGATYENWNQKSDYEPDTMYSFKEWCDLIIDHVEAPNYIFIGPSEKNEENSKNKVGLFAKKVGIKWYPQYTNLNKDV